MPDPRPGREAPQTSTAGGRSGPVPRAGRGEAEPGHAEAAAVAVFTALADPTRRRLLDQLARNGPTTVSELAAMLPITRQAVAKHLAQLVAAGLLVAEEPDGRRVRYRTRPEPLQAALGWLSAMANRWDDHLDALRSHLDRDEDGDVDGHGDPQKHFGDQAGNGFDQRG